MRNHLEFNLNRQRFHILQEIPQLFWIYPFYHRRRITTHRFVRRPANHQNFPFLPHFENILSGSFLILLSWVLIFFKRTRVPSHYHQRMGIPNNIYRITTTINREKDQRHSYLYSCIPRREEMQVNHL